MAKFFAILGFLAFLAVAINAAAKVPRKKGPSVTTTTEAPTAENLVTAATGSGIEVVESGLGWNLKDLAWEVIPEKSQTEKDAGEGKNNSEEGGNGENKEKKSEEGNKIAAGHQNRGRQGSRKESGATRGRSRKPHNEEIQCEVNNNSENKNRGGSIRDTRSSDEDENEDGDSRRGGNNRRRGGKRNRGENDGEGEEERRGGKKGRRRGNRNGQDGRREQGAEDDVKEGREGKKETRGRKSKVVAVGDQGSLGLIWGWNSPLKQDSTGGGNAKQIQGNLGWGSLKQAEIILEEQKRLTEKQRRAWEDYNKKLQEDTEKKLRLLEQQKIVLAPGPVLGWVSSPPPQQGGSEGKRNEGRKGAGGRREEQRQTNLGWGYIKLNEKVMEEQKRLTRKLREEAEKSLRLWRQQNNVKLGSDGWAVI